MSYTKKLNQQLKIMLESLNEIKKSREVLIKTISTDPMNKEVLLELNKNIDLMVNMLDRQYQNHIAIAMMQYPNIAQLDAYRNEQKWGYITLAAIIGVLALLWFLLK